MTDKMDKNIFFVSPNFIFESQGKFKTTNIGFYVSKKPLIGGFFYRKRTLGDNKNDDSFIVFLGIHQELNKELSLRMGYSYDFTLNNLASNSLGSHEVSIVLEFNNLKICNKNPKANKRNKKIADCSDFGPSKGYKGF